MPQQRKYASAACRQAAYRARQQRACHQQLQERGLPPLPAIASVPGSARWRSALVSAQTLVALVCQEMTYYRDDRSDTWQQSERGQAFSERLEEMEVVLSQIETLV